MRSSAHANSASVASEAEQDHETNSGEDLPRRNASLEQNNLKLQQLAEYRSAFLSHLAHELRTPLTSILGFSEIMLSHEELTEAQRGFCERIQNSAQEMQNSLKQLTDLARLETSPAGIQRERLSPEDLLHEAGIWLARQAQQREVKLKFRDSGGLAWIVSDRGKTRHVFYNLLGYAITRSPNGSQILVAAEAVEQSLLIRIEDDGEPIDIDEIATLDRSARKLSAPELSLAIARQTLGLLGGSLSFRNREPRGVEITIILPATLPDS